MEMQKLSVAALYGNTVWGCVIHKVANVGEISCVYLFFPRKLQASCTPLDQCFGFALLANSVKVLFISPTCMY
jgi:hypothetical protein